MKKINEYSCHFCHQLCRRRKTKMPKQRFWYICQNCPTETSYLVDIHGKLSRMDFNFPADLPSLFHLLIDYDNKYSKLEYWKKVPYINVMGVLTKRFHFNITKLLELDQIIKDVTPDNVKDKFKTYLTFS